MNYTEGPHFGDFLVSLSMKSNPDIWNYKTVHSGSPWAQIAFLEWPTRGRSKRSLVNLNRSLCCWGNTLRRWIIWQDPTSDIFKFGNTDKLVRLAPFFIYKTSQLRSFIKQENCQSRLLRIKPLLFETLNPLTVILITMNACSKLGWLALKVEQFYF